MLNPIKKIWNWIETAQQQRADYWILNNLTDRELRDLGIGRSQIRELVYGKESYGKTTEVS